MLRRLAIKPRNLLDGISTSLAPQKTSSTKKALFLAPLTQPRASHETLLTFLLLLESQNELTEPSRNSKPSKMIFGTIQRLGE
jgi:hypothetical protein